MEEETPKTERDKYIEALEGKLAKAGKARRFLDDNDGKMVTDWLTQQVNALVKTLAGTKYINDNNLANYDRGQLALAQKLLTMLNSEAGTDTTDVQERLQAAKTDG